MTAPDRAAVEAFLRWFREDPDETVIETLGDQQLTVGMLRRLVAESKHRDVVIAERDQARVEAVAAQNELAQVKAELERLGRVEQERDGSAAVRDVGGPGLNALVQAGEPRAVAEYWNHEAEKRYANDPDGTWTVVGHVASYILAAMNTAEWDIQEQTRTRQLRAAFAAGWHSHSAAMNGALATIGWDERERAAKDWVSGFAGSIAERCPFCGPNPTIGGLKCTCLVRCGHEDCAPAADLAAQDEREAQR